MRIIAILNISLFYHTMNPSLFHPTKETACPPSSSLLFQKSLFIDLTGRAIINT